MRDEDPIGGGALGKSPIEICTVPTQSELEVVDVVFPDWVDGTIKALQVFDYN
jgi:hypothetical protein